MCHFLPYNEGFIQLPDNVFEKREHIPNSNGGIYRIFFLSFLLLISFSIFFSSLFLFLILRLISQFYFKYVIFKSERKDRILSFFQITSNLAGGNKQRSDRLLFFSLFFSSSVKYFCFILK